MELCNQLLFGNDINMCDSLETLVNYKLDSAHITIWQHLYTGFVSFEK